MQFRAFVPAVLVIAAASVPAGAQGFGYAPGTAQYHASVVTKMTREIAGRRMEDEITQSQRLTVGLAAGAGDTLRIGVTVDSASVVMKSAGPQDVSPLVGLRVDGRISRLGDFYSSTLAGRGIGPTGTLVANELARFLPRLRSDIRVGLAWTDTTSERIDMLGIPVERRIITRSVVGGDTTLAGVRAWRIDRSSTVAFTGNGTMNGQEVRLAGGSNAQGVIVVSRSGRYLGSEQRDTVTTSFTIPATGAQVAMTQTQTSTISKVD